MKHILFIPIAVALAVSACGTSADSGSGSAVTSPTSPLTTETFTGTVAVGASDIHNFVIAQTGELDITLTAAGPPSTIFMGVGIGTLSGANCVFLPNGTANVQASTTPQLTGTSVTSGSYCVSVYDIGNQAAPVTYSLTVVHS
jgi:hypothetical protein